MSLIVVVGPPAAGKDVVIEGLLHYFGLRYPGQVSRSAYYSTRRKRPTDRPGENVILISRAEFMTRQERGEIVSPDVSHFDLVGHSAEQLLQTPLVFASASKKNIPELQDFIRLSGGSMVSLYLDVPLKVRRNRLLKREDNPDSSYVDSKLANGVGSVPANERSVFDFVYQNPDGELDQTVEKIATDVESFVATAIKEATTYQSGE